MDEEISKIKFALKCVKSPIQHVACKSASIFAHMALEAEKRPLLIEKHLLDVINLFFSLFILSST